MILSKQTCELLDSFVQVAASSVVAKKNINVANV
jgi:hypothetical protein